MKRHSINYRAAFAVIFALSSCAVTKAAEPSRPWTRSNTFAEQSFTASAEPDVRIHVNAPLDDAGQPARGTRLIIYALPNGNTLEQTLGCQMADGLDWHFDIQHVAAQVRLFRSLVPEESVVLICAEAKGLSWPTWRANHDNANERIARLVDEWRSEFGTEDAKVTLTGHSGGGSFKFGVIEGAEDIPATIDRIAFLDSNYSFDADKHADKFARWLTGDETRRLIVVAYDDREIMLDGKKVVGPTGGTFRASGRMRDTLGPTFSLVESEKLPFHEYSGLDGRLRFFIHPNPENKILHTVLVGEMNGLVEVLTLGTANEETWGTFDKPRVYTKWVQAEPTSKPSPLGATGSASALPDTTKQPTPTIWQSQLPTRPADAIGGNEFVKQIDSMKLVDREAAILHEITSGNFPDFLRAFKSVAIKCADADGKELAATLQVMPDYLAVGSNDDFVRMPMTPQTAQKIADQFGCTLPTRKIVDAIDEQAEIHVEPRPLTEQREAVATFLQHHQIIEEQRAGKPLGPIITGIKKDIVISPRIFERPDRLAIYGWRKLDGQPIQDLTIVHVNRYVDYSHGARLVLNKIECDGKETSITDFLADPDRCALVSDEGPMNPPRYSQ